MYNHYIRKDENNNIINCFSSAFKQSTTDDILYKENTNKRHFNLQLYSGSVFFQQYKYRWDGTSIEEKTQIELETEVATWKKNIDNKVLKFKIIRNMDLNFTNWINGLKTAQDYGHGKGINKKGKVIPDSLMDQWAAYFEDYTYWLDDNDINAIDYDQLYVGSSILPIKPPFPNDIV